MDMVKRVGIDCGSGGGGEAGELWGAGRERGGNWDD